MYEGMVLIRHHVDTLLDELYMKTFFATFIAVITAVFNAIGSLVHILIMLMVISFCLDFWLAWREHKVSRMSMNKVILKTVLYAIGALVVGLAAQAIAVSTGTTFGIDTWFISLICVNEAMACLATLSNLGFPIPPWIIKRLQAFNDDPIKASRNE